MKECLHLHAADVCLNCGALTRWDGRIQGDARHLPLAANSVQCIITSPPYWNLRSYRTHGMPAIGNEASVEEHVAAIVATFREAHRVLKSDGTCWINLGDSYAQSGGRGVQGRTSQRNGRGNVSAQEKSSSQAPPPGLKPKDLVGMPWRIALALQADGWWLRSDIVWHKLNPTPEPVRDRPTRSHEFIFLLAKAERYYYNAAAIKEPCSEGTHARYKTGAGPSSKQDGTGNRQVAGFNQRFFGKKAAGMKETLIKGNGRFYQNCNERVEMRNKRSVWALPTQPYSESHYAVFSPALIEPCILAGSRPGDIVLDPFAGSGTTALVAERLSRRWISIDLGYQDLQTKRLTNVQRDLVW